MLHYIFMLRMIRYNHDVTGLYVFFLFQADVIANQLTVITAEMIKNPIYKKRNSLYTLAYRSDCVC